ncbi:alpha/beta hydrolase [Leifsonia xyli]|uniref:alpha/beta hydrolase n=1 Tax=Leifsonia xyli TaxID=1575 RepID=UPI003D67077E
MRRTCSASSTTTRTTTALPRRRTDPRTNTTGCGDRRSPPTYTRNPIRYTPALPQDGAWQFAAELDGTHATRAGKLPYVGVVAHSYGTTTTANALTHTKYPVDSYTMLGSAGIDTTTVHAFTDLHVKTTDGAAAIYTTAAQLDFLAPFGSAMGGRAEPNPEAAQSPERGRHRRWDG